MSTKRKTQRRSKATPGKGKQHPRHFAKVYWPYIPIIAVVVFGMVFGNVRPSQRVNRPATLAYATEMSISGLFSETNSQRAANGFSNLSLNSKLNMSAQAKANDMVARNYWSHNTPEGQEPWVFFDDAGYVYLKAGENLAYGFDNSVATVEGWMNSPSHRANILDGEYEEVGFGFANGEDFVGTGTETIVVAHYGNPYGEVEAAPVEEKSAPQPPSNPQTQQSQTTVQNPPAQPVEKSAQTTPTEPEPISEPEPESLPESRINQPITSAATVPDNVPSVNITRLQSLTGGRAPWSALALSVAAFTVVIIWFGRHAILVRRFILRGEHFVAHHPIFDFMVVVVSAMAVYLSQSSGVVL